MFFLSVFPESTAASGYFLLIYVHLILYTLIENFCINNNGANAYYKIHILMNHMNKNIFPFQGTLSRKGVKMTQE